MTTLPRSFGSVLSGPRTDDATALGRYAKTGDPAAFETLTRRYQGMVFGTCLRVLRSAADAEDAAQETFLKLAKNAGSIGGNAAAWLHACALGTSKDLLRARVSRARAEQHACPHDGADGDADRRAWREIEPHLDDALAQLSQEECDAIVGHFLAGRPQKELAREAGVSAGTMSRRIERALASLGDRLRVASPGITLASAAGAIASILSLGAKQSLAASANLSAPLAKVALAHAAISGKTAAGSSLASPAILGLLAAGLLAGGASLIYFKQPGSKPPAALAAVSGSVPRPTRDSDEFEVVDQTVDGGPAEDFRATIDDRNITMRFSDREKSIKHLVRLSIESGPLAQKRGTLRVKIAELVLGKEDGFNKELGNSATCDYELSADRLALNLAIDGQEQEKPSFAFVRVKDVPVKDPDSIVGEWERRAHLRVRFASDAILISDVNAAPGRGPMRLRVLDWSDGSGYSKASTICAASPWFPPLIGKRVKLFVRKDERGYTLALHDFDSDRLDEFPSGFTPGKGERVQVLTAREATR